MKTYELTRKGKEIYGYSDPEIIETHLGYKMEVGKGNWFGFPKSYVENKSDLFKEKIGTEYVITTTKIKDGIHIPVSYSRVDIRTLYEIAQIIKTFKTKTKCQNKHTPKKTKGC